MFERARPSAPDRMTRETVILQEHLYSPFAWDRYLQKLELKYYSETATRHWARQFWPWIFALSFAYVALCFLGVRWMRDRAKFGLRRPLVMWNASLALYSMLALWRMLPGIVHDVASGRWSDLSCSLDFFEHVGAWCFMFPFSKLFEFGDTLFVVLKKKPLIFLHWYHHITVLWFCWYSYVLPIGPGRMFSAVNLFVHSVMYTYYGIVASGLVRLPRWINMAVTTLQISQMFVGIWVSSFAYYRYSSGEPCATTGSHFALGMAMYISYMALFGNYFYMTYMRRKPVSATEQQHVSTDADTATAAAVGGSKANGTTPNGNGSCTPGVTVTCHVNGHTNGVNGHGVTKRNGHVKSN